MNSQQLNIFSDSDLNIKSKNNFDLINSIPGLRYVENFLSEEEHQDIWDSVYKSPWLGDLKRRVQHYGFKYDYRKRAIDHSMFLGKIPDWTEKYAKRLMDRGYISELPDQIIVNEYSPGQGIADHIDCEPCFKDTIISLSLGADIVMQLKEKKDKRNKVEVLLEPKSLIIINGDARYKWTHGIPSRKTDNFNGYKFDRKLRTSLTFRKVILG